MSNIVKMHCATCDAETVFQQEQSNVVLHIIICLLLAFPAALFIDIGGFTPPIKYMVEFGHTLPQAQLFQLVFLWTGIILLFIWPVKMAISANKTKALICMACNTELQQHTPAARTPAEKNSFNS